VIKKIFRELGSWFEGIFINNIPGKIGYYVRRVYWKIRLKECSKIILGQGCIITSPENISIGEDTVINQEDPILLFEQPQKKAQDG